KPPTTAPPSVRHTVRREPGSRATLEVEVDADRLARAADVVFARHVQHAKIPGFRPGKAPRAMYERTYGREHLWEEAAEDLIVDIDAKVGERTLSFARNAHIEAGKELGITGLGEALVGMRAGEEKKVELTFPEDTSEGELAGKTGTFSIRPSQVAEKVLPALDDGFAKTVGVADIETLRRTVRNELAHAAFHEAPAAAADKAMDHARA